MRLVRLSDGASARDGRTGNADRSIPSSRRAGCYLIETAIKLAGTKAGNGDAAPPPDGVELPGSATETKPLVLAAIPAAWSWHRYRQQPDFIQSYIFPGGVLPNVDIIRQQADRTGLELTAHEPFGLSYARTLAV